MDIFKPQSMFTDLTATFSPFSLQLRTFTSFDFTITSLPLSQGPLGFFGDFLEIKEILEIFFLVFFSLCLTFFFLFFFSQKRGYGEFVNHSFYLYVGVFEP